MKKLITIFTLMLIFTISGIAQTTCQKVCKQNKTNCLANGVPYVLCQKSYEKCLTQCCRNKQCFAEQPITALEPLIVAETECDDENAIVSIDWFGR